jgi:proteic killer suppression protein
MIVTFEKEYLQELYVKGKASDKKHRFQPDVISRYIKVVNIMKNVADVLELVRFNGLHYEHLQGDKSGYSSVRVNDKYRIEFVERIVNDETIATVCNITELTNHYK